MNFTRLVEKRLIRLFLIATFIPLQSCSNTLIGEKLENSFDIIEAPVILESTSKVKVDNKTLDSTKRILKDYIRYTIGNSPKSEYFMDEIIQKEKNRL